MPWSSARILAVAFAIALASCSQDKAPGAGPGSVTLRVADQFGLVRLPLSLSGQDRGTGYDIEYSSFQGAAAVLQAFHAGVVDVGVGGDAILTQAQASGTDVVVVQVNEAEGIQCSLLVSPRARIRSFADLKGRKVGYTPATGSQSFLLHLLARQNLSIGDIQAIDLPVPTYLATLASGDVDAVSACEPLPSSFRAAEPGATILTEPGLYSGFMYMIVSRAALDDPAKAEALGDFIGRYIRGCRWRDAHPAEWVKAYYVEGLGLPEQLGTAIMAKAGATRFPPVDAVVIGEQQRLNDLIFAAGGLPRRIDAAPAFTGRYNAVIAEAGR